MNPKQVTILIMLTSAVVTAAHFIYLAPAGPQHLPQLFRIYRSILVHYWHQIALFMSMASVVVYRISRWVWIKVGRRETGALTAYAGRAFGSGNLPLEVENPDGR